MGLIAYAFLANKKVTINRPADEHRFQIKYGSKDGQLHELWQDPFGLYTTLLVGIDPEEGFFVSADPILHSPTRFFISLEFKQNHVDEILGRRWHVWERERRGGSDDPAEVLVGGTPESFLRCIRFEREVLGEDQGHRQLVGERFQGWTEIPVLSSKAVTAPSVSRTRVHALARELDLTESEVLDLIESAPRLKMAVRGWVAEEHLVRMLRLVPDVSDCQRLSIEGGTDVGLRFRGSMPITVECKNVLRKARTDGRPRLDFQRTRAAKSDACSRYYKPGEFDIVAACLHPVTERWEFRFARPSQLDPHRICEGRLSQNVCIDTRWTAEVTHVLTTVVSSQ